MFNNFGLHVTNILKKMEEERSLLNHPFVGSEHLILSVLKNDVEISKKFENFNINYDLFKEKLLKIVGKPKKNVDFNLYTPLLKRVINNSVEDAVEDNNGEVTTNHLMRALLEEGEGVAIRILVAEDIDLDELYDVFKVKSKQNKNKESEFGKNLNETVDMFELTVGRDKEINFIIETLLRKKKNNPLLLGEAGVGKTAIVEELARKINSGRVPKELENCEVISLEMSSLIAGTKYRGEFEEKLTKIIEKLEKDKKYILFIDEVHTMVSAGGAEGAIGAGDIFKPYLARGNIKCIGATTNEEYDKYISKDKALARRFEIINIKEPTLEETINILFKVKSEYEKHHHVSISKKNISSIVGYCDKYIFNKKNPDKSLDFLDSVCTMIHVKSDNTDKVNKYINKLSKLKKLKEEAVEKNNYKKAIEIHDEELKYEEKLKSLNKVENKNIKENDILKVLESKSSVPMLHNKKEIINKLYDSLKKNILGQDKVLEKIKRVFEYKLTDICKPLLVLLAGSSGVGKTEVTKIISENFDKSMKFIKLSGAEYNSDISINKLIGTPGGYVGYSDNYVLNQLKYNPYAVIVIDNFDKLSPNVRNLIFELNENGYILDSKGEKINCNNIVILATVTTKSKTNVGFEKNESNNLEEILSKEILENFDDIITFEDISDESFKNYLRKHKLNENKYKEYNYKLYGLKNMKKELKKNIDKVTI